MEGEKSKAYVAGLEQILRSTHLDLKEVMEEFQDLCQRVSLDRKISPGITSDIRKAYKRIQDHLGKIRGVQQLLQSKYRAYHHRDASRDRELAEFAFLAKSLYSKFEFTIQEIDAKRRLKSGEGQSLQIPFSWFQSRENQIFLLQNLDNLNELSYEMLPGSSGEEKRRVTQKTFRSISLFALSGESLLIESLDSRMRLREYDIKERYKRDELRGALTHLKEVSPSEVEGVIRRYTGGMESSKLKGLFLSIQSQRDLEKEILRTTEKILLGMGGGEIRILAI